MKGCKSANFLLIAAGSRSHLLMRAATLSLIATCLILRYIA